MPNAIVFFFCFLLILINVAKSLKAIQNIAKSSESCKMFATPQLPATCYKCLKSLKCCQIKNKTTNEIKSLKYHKMRNLQNPIKCCKVFEIQ